MKKFILKLLIFMIICSFALGSQVSVYADEVTIRPLENAKQWKLTRTTSFIELNDNGELIMVPTDGASNLQGAIYNAVQVGNGSFEFSYQLDYADGVDPYTYEDHSASFFGLMFQNNLQVQSDEVTAENSIPFPARDCYPYMLAFDTENGGPSAQTNRMKQKGLTLRRYPYDGHHNYTRWSTVDPTEETFLTDTGRTYESKIPDQYVPVTVDECFNEEKHTVKVDIQPLFVSEGAEKDAMQIKVWFDDELVMTVLDEMPFEGEFLGEPVDVDKRTSDGYFSFYAMEGEQGYEDSTYGKVADFVITFSDMTVVNRASNAGNDITPAPAGNGCSSAIHFGLMGGAAVLTSVAALAFCMRKKEENN